MNHVDVIRCPAYIAGQKQKMMKRCTAIILMLLFITGYKAGAQSYTGKLDTSIIITQQWKMPDILKEISGITSIDENRLACIQDEKGIIFIYNLLYDSIEKEIPFAGDFDFEGIALAGKTMYAIRSNGILYSIDNYNSAAPVIKEIPTWLTVKQNTEGLCYDAKHNRLLIAIKDKDPVGKNYKGIYEYNLRNGKLARKPVFRINLNDTIFHKDHKIRPSDLAVNPGTGDIYITDGERPSLLIMSPAGLLKKIYYLDGKDFHLPEGITFSKQGQLFICNERGLLKAGNITEIVINE